MEKNLVKAAVENFEKEMEGTREYLNDFDNKDDLLKEAMMIIGTLTYQKNKLYREKRKLIKILDWFFEESDLNFKE